MKFLLRLSVVLAVATAAGLCRAQSASTAPLTQRFAALVSHRLDLARQVAWTKFNSSAPVYDPARESTMLESLVASGTAKGISDQVTRPFFQAQVAASRQVQDELIASWKAGGKRPATKPLDLKTQLRPQLDTVNADLVAVLSTAPGLASDPDALRRIRTNLAKGGYSDRVVAIVTGSKG